MENYFGEIVINNKTSKSYVLVVYDISDSKRRLKISRLLESYGYRVQKSVFEIMIDQKKLKVLVSKIDAIVEAEDLLKIYIVSGINKTYSWGMIQNIEEEIIIL